MSRFCRQQGLEGISQGLFLAGFKLRISITGRGRGVNAIGATSQHPLVVGKAKKIKPALKIDA